MSYAEVPKEQPAPAEQAQESSSQKIGYSVSTTNWDKNRSFKQEIPEELTNEKLVGNGIKRFNFFSRIVRDKYRWGKVEKDADDVDKKLGNLQSESTSQTNESTSTMKNKNNVTLARESINLLNSDCFDYIKKIKMWLKMKKTIKLRQHKKRKVKKIVLQIVPMLLLN